MIPTMKTLKQTSLSSSNFQIYLPESVREIPVSDINNVTPSAKESVSGNCNKIPIITKHIPATVRG